MTTAQQTTPKNLRIQYWLVTLETGETFFTSGWGSTAPKWAMRWTYDEPQSRWTGRYQNMGGLGRCRVMEDDPSRAPITRSDALLFDLRRLAVAARDNDRTVISWATGRRDEWVGQMSRRQVVKVISAVKTDLPRPIEMATADYGQSHNMRGEAR